MKKKIGELTVREVVKMRENCDKCALREPCRHLNACPLYHFIGVDLNQEIEVEGFERSGK